MAEPTSTPTTTKPARKSRVARSPQDQRIANEISNFEQAVSGALEADDVMARLKARSYDEKELKKGLALHGAAQAAFNSRQSSSGTAGKAKQMRDEVEAAARQLFSDYRQTCQANYLLGTDRKA